jgi:hypothetical protein
MCPGQLVRRTLTHGKRLHERVAQIDTIGDAEADESSDDTAMYRIDDRGEGYDAFKRLAHAPGVFVSDDHPRVIELQSTHESELNTAEAFERFARVQDTPHERAE